MDPIFNFVSNFLEILFFIQRCGAIFDAHRKVDHLSYFLRKKWQTIQSHPSLLHPPPPQQQQQHEHSPITIVLHVVMIHGLHGKNHT